MAVNIPPKSKKKSNTHDRSIIWAGLSMLVLMLGIFSVVYANRDTNRSTHAATPQPTGQSGNWNPVFDEEFNTTTLNNALWTPGWFGNGISGPVNSEDISCYDSSLVQLPGDGYLHLKFIQQPETCSGTTRPYAGAMVSSNPGDGLTGHTGFQYTYGYMEVRAYLPPSASGSASIANWPAFWSDGQNWPNDGENDILEGLSGKACYHYHSPSGGPGDCALGDYTGWHTFASDWEPGFVKYYYDGTLVGQITTGITSSPQYVILDQGQGSNNGAIVNPSDVLVDYVRIWQAAATPSATATPIPTLTPTINPADTIRPSISITAPLNSATVKRNSTITLAATAIDNIQVSKVVFSASNGSTCTDTSVPFSCNWSVPSKPNVSYTITATAYDAANNSSSTSIKVTAK